MVKIHPASIGPNAAIGNSGQFGIQIATTFPNLRPNLVCNRTAKALEWSRNWAYVKERFVTPQTYKNRI